MKYVLLIVSCMVFASTAAAQESIAIRTATVTNFYLQPRGRVVAFIPKNELLNVYDVQDGFLLVEWKSMVGYVSRAAIKESSSLAEFIATIERQKEARLEALMQKINTLAKDNIPVLIQSINVTGPNTVGGVGFEISGFLANERPVKYLRATVRPFNRVGDVQSSEVGGQSDFRIEVPGPFEEVYGSFKIGPEIAWYNETIVCAEVKRFEVEYMDGTKGIYVNDLRKMFMEEGANDCSYRAN